MSLPAYDPDRYLQYEVSHRMAVYRKVAVFVPSGALFTWLLLVAALQLPGTIIAVVLLGICTLALDVEAWHALRDLVSRPVTTRGQVRRIFSKPRFAFFGKVHYMFVDKQMFEVDVVAAMELREGDEVEVVHWPHTGVIVTVERVAGVERGSD
jgi:hypothetical protein